MYNIEVKNTGGYVFDVTAGDQTCKVDAKGNGMTPPGMLLAGLASCVGVYIRKYAEGAKLLIGEFEVSAEAEFTKEAPMRFGEIRITVDLKGAALDDRRKKALTEFIKNCPVHNTMKGNPVIDMILM